MMMLADFLDKVANALNERFVAAGLDRVVPKEANAEHTISEKIDSWRSTGSMFLGVPRKPLQSVVDRADFAGVVGRARSSHPVERRRVYMTTGPHNKIIAIHLSVCTSLRAAVTVTLSELLSTLVHLLHLYYTSLRFYPAFILYIYTDSTYTVGTRFTRNLRGRLSTSSTRGLGSFYYFQTCILYSWFTNGLWLRVIGCVV